MNARERFERVERIFRLAVALPAAERTAFVAAECGDDEAMRSELLGMMQADARPSGMLDRGVLGSGADLAGLADVAALANATGTEPRPHRMPARIGRFEIVGIVGEGGMGVVYEARQDAPRRSVALKVMNAGAASRRSLQRFRHEAQVLGRLQHPGIAQIFEAGVDDWGDGPQPYFAMELVAGSGLLEFAVGRGLDIRERVALLARICDAVHHAHQKGVLHRDLKPANILVVDGDVVAGGDSSSGSHDLPGAQPKILDFGVARLLDPDLALSTLQSGVGQILGTVPYMSPEQAEGASGAVDIRSDVYSLGVIAYELLSGRHPHELHGRPLHEALRILREDTPPRLATFDRRLRGDLETIVAKALDKDVARRYASAAEMAADLRRVLRHEPIQAKRTGAVDQLRKFARRNRGLVSAAALAVAALAVATVVSLRLAMLAEAARIEERRLREVADRRTDEAERNAYRSDVSAAAASIRWHEVADATRQLDAAPPARRGWEWDHLRSRLDDSIASATGYKRHATRIVFRPDGREILTATPTGVLQSRRIEDLAPTTEGRIEGGFRARWTCDVSVAGDGETIRLASRRAVMTLDPRTLRATVAWSSADEILAADRDAQFAAVQAARPGGAQHIVVRRLADNGVIVERGPLRDRPGIAAFSPDGRLVALSGIDLDGLSVHATHDGDMVLHRPDLRVAHRVRFGRDGDTLAVAMPEGFVHLVPLHGNDERDLVLAGDGAAVTSMDFSHDGARFATACEDGTVRLWLIDDGRCVAILNGHAGGASDIAFSPDDTRVATVCGDDGTVRLWSAQERADPFVLTTPQTVYALAFSPDGSRLAAACLGGEHPVRIWDRFSGLELAAFGDGAASAIAFDPDGGRLAFGRSHGETDIVRASDGAQLARLPRQWWRTDWVAFSADGTSLLSFDNGGALRSFDVRTGELQRQFAVARTATNIGNRAALSPRGDRLVITVNRELALLDPDAFIEHGRLTGHTDRVTALTFGADGCRLASGGLDRTVRVWDVAERRTIAVLEGHTDSVNAVALSPDGTRLASAGADRVIRIWDTRTWDQLVKLGGHTAFIYCLAWSPDGTCLASGGADDTVRMWDTRPFREVVNARR